MMRTNEKLTGYAHGYRLCVLAIVTGSAVTLVCTQRADSQGPPCLVTTVNGDVQGLDNGASCTFLGIPFAAPPIGDLRWKPPQPAIAWAPVPLNATLPHPACPNVIPPGSMTIQGMRTA